MASAPPSQPARSRRRRRDFGAALEFRGTGPRGAVARHGTEAGETADRAVARAQRASCGGGIRAGVSAALAGRSGAEIGPRGDRSRAPGARAEPGAGLRPALESGHGEPNGDAAAQGYSGAAARPAFQHSASRVSPRGAGAAHGQPRPMVEPSPVAAAPPVRGDRRSRADNALS